MTSIDDSHCAACGVAIPGEVQHRIHRDGFGLGPEVAICHWCGAFELPSCQTLWEDIKARNAGETTPPRAEPHECHCSEAP